MTENVTADAVCGYNVSAKDNVHNGAIESSSDSGSCGYYVDMVKNVCNVEYTYHVDHTHMVANAYMTANVYASHIVCPVSRTLNVTIVSDAYHVDSVCRVSDVNYIHSSVMPHSVFPEYIVYSGCKGYEVYVPYNERRQHRQHHVYHVHHVGMSSFSYCNSWESGLCHGLTRQASHKPFSFQGNTAMQCAISVTRLKNFLPPQYLIGQAGSFPVIVIQKRLIIRTSNHTRGLCLHKSLRNKMIFWSSLLYQDSASGTAPSC